MTRQLLAALRLPRPGVVAMLIPRPLPAFHSSALVIGTLLLAACAPADSGTNTASPPPSDSFDLVDTDHDGTVEMDEWNAVGEQVFVSLDADNGGSISPAELADGYDSLDLNRDGVIVRGEVDAPSLDTNSDGVISREEWRSTILREKMDTDQDGKISRAEYEAYRSATFAGQDRDGNRWIDRAEVGWVVSKNLGAKFTMFKF